MDKLSMCNKPQNDKPDTDDEVITLNVHLLDEQKQDDTKSIRNKDSKAKKPKPLTKKKPQKNEPAANKETPSKLNEDELITLYACNIGEEEEPKTEDVPSQNTNAAPSNTKLKIPVEIGQTEKEEGYHNPSKNPPINIEMPNMRWNPLIHESDVKLINLNDVEIIPVNWFWKPYIPLGKVTVLQGDPGDGKTTLMLEIAAAATRGAPLPGGGSMVEPVNIIYQTAEDGLGDTIKPRLEKAGADCSRVYVIDDSDKELTLSDTRLEEAIIETGAKLLILDPLQAYIGADVDFHRANEIRPVLKRLSSIAEIAECAIVIIGHLNKGTNKSQYRGLGSIDIQAAARSVLTLGRIKNQPYLRAFAHGKSNLAAEGESIAFELNPDPSIGFRWIGEYPITIDELLSYETGKERASTRAINFLQNELKGKTIPSKELYDMASGEGISERTLKRVKKDAGAYSYKSQDQWYWTMNEQDDQQCQQYPSEKLASLFPSDSDILEDEK